MHRIKAELFEEIEIDTLTGLYSEQTAAHMIAEMLANAHESDSCALLVLEVDNVEAINHTFGCLRGDAVLERVASILRGIFRESDVIGRMGNDRFLVGVRAVPGKMLMDKKLRELIRRAGRELRCAGHAYTTSVYVGAAFCHKQKITYHKLLEQALEALYQAKNSVRERYCFYEQRTLHGA